MLEAQRRKVKKLKEISREIRKTLLTMIYEAQSGHPGGSLSAADLISALYFDEMNYEVDDVKCESRDRFILSKGHVCPVLYAVLIHKGCLPQDSVYTLRKYGSRLQGHPDMKRCPGVEMSTGSLGQGLSAAVGMSIALKRDGMPNRVFCLLGDGECQEGQIWEAVQAATKYDLDNLTIIVDHNRLQNDGTVEEIMPVGSLKDKFCAFGCEVREIDGHDMEEIVDTFDEIREIKGKPKCIIAKTVKGKGVSFMENVVAWHGTPPNEAQYKQALAEIEGDVS